MTNHGFLIALCICCAITLTTCLLLSTVFGGDISIENNPNFVAKQDELGSNIQIENVWNGHLRYGNYDASGIYKMTMNDGTICYVIRSYESSGISCLKP